MHWESRYLTNQYFIKKYDENNYELVYMNYPIKQQKEKKLNNNKTYDYKLENNISRSRTAIFEYAMVNDFEYFVTLTINPEKLDAYNLSDYIKKFGQFIRDNRKHKKSNIQYLLIPEKHLSGAWHMHGLIKGINKNELFINDNGYLDWFEYKKRFGYISLKKINDVKGDKLRISKYITKYISKDLAENQIGKENKLYYVTRGLKKCKRVNEGYMTENILNELKFDFENDFIKKKILSKTEYEKYIMKWG